MTDREFSFRDEPARVVCPWCDRAVTVVLCAAEGREGAADVVTCLDTGGEFVAVRLHGQAPVALPIQKTVR